MSYRVGVAVRLLRKRTQRWERGGGEIYWEVKSVTDKTGEGGVNIKGSFGQRTSSDFETGGRGANLGREHLRPT